MASWDGAIQGGTSAAATGNPWLIAAGALLGGLFGSKERYSPEQLMQRRISQQLEQFAGSVPLSDPLEQGALASQRGFLGEEQRQDMGTLMSMGPAYANTGTAGSADMMKSMLAAQSGQRMALSSQALMNALASRRRALLEAAQVAQGVGKPSVQPGLGGDFAALMRAYSQYSAAKAGGQQQNPYGQGNVTTGGQSTPGGMFHPTAQAAGPTVPRPGTPTPAPVTPGQSFPTPATPPGVGGNGMGNLLNGMGGGSALIVPQGVRWGYPTNNGAPNNAIYGNSDIMGPMYGVDPNLARLLQMQGG